MYIIFVGNRGIKSEKAHFLEHKEVMNTLFERLGE